MFKQIGLTLSVALLLLLASCGTDTTAEKESGTETTEDVAEATTDVAEAATDVAEATSKAVSYVTMPANTQIAVTLTDSIDTDVHVSGQEFSARLARPIVVDGQTLFADGAQAKGILNKVVESGRLKTPAELDFSLTAIQDPSGQWVAVTTGMIQENKDSHTKREVAMIGGGALVGGVIGKIIDKKGSTEIGAAAGAAAGTGLSAATGKQDIFLGPGTEVVFLSSQPTQVAIR